MTREEPLPMLAFLTFKCHRSKRKAHLGPNRSARSESWPTTTLETLNMIACGVLDLTVPIL